MSFNLSQTKANTGNVGNGLSARTISTTAGTGRSALQVNPNAGQIGFRPTNLPPVIQDQTSDSIQAFANVAIQAAQNFQDRESTYMASQAAVEFKERARQAYNGHDNPETGAFVPGYVQTKGGTAVNGYSNFKESLEKSMTDMVSKMEPRVQQKALVQMHSTLNSYLGKAATHRSTQLGFAEEQQRAQKLKAINLDIVADPSKIYEVDPGTGMNLKGDFYTQFDEQTKADKAWYDTMAGTTSLVYQNTYRDVLKQGGSDVQALNTAARQAQLYFNGVAGPEMAPDAEGSARVLAKLKRWNEEGIASAAQGRAYLTYKEVKLV